ncbi:MAG: 4-hydroxy-tetrahydrodipicolinate reductase [Magnetococcales bacterium]|nr:4-hydroxy-tetrahydrodipicolinate reductase [Magnetococcales bacterium]
MGRTLLQTVRVTAGCQLTAACEGGDSDSLGLDSGRLIGEEPSGIIINDQVENCFRHSQVVIDFSVPQATLAYLDWAEKTATPMVIGTTGLDWNVRERLQQVARHVAIVQAPNFSIGVNLMLNLAEQAAQVLGDEFDVEIIEAHHRHKADAPSGTALRLGETVAAVLGRSLENDAIYGRQGMIGARQPGSIGFATVRGGTIVGDHTLLFAGEGERLEITHRAASRTTFAQGAVRAAQWVVSCAPGLYDMQDVLGLRP